MTEQEILHDVEKAVGICEWRNLWAARFLKALETHSLARPAHMALEQKFGRRATPPLHQLRRWSKLSDSWFLAPMSRRLAAHLNARLDVCAGPLRVYRSYVYGWDRDGKRRHIRSLFHRLLTEAAKRHADQMIELRRYHDDLNPRWLRLQEEVAQ